MTWLLELSPGPLPQHLVALVLTLVAGALATRAVMALAPRWDFVSRPKGERWSTRPVPMGGGIAIYLAMAPGLLFVSRDLLVAATLVFLLGLIDDRRPLSPKIKLLVQGVAACWMAAGPLDPGEAATIMSGPAWFVLPITVGWYVGMANSVNLLDNMDGSAAGVAAIAGGVIYALAVGGGSPDPSVALGAAVVTGAAVGFLVFNFPPAKIFMGDAGSLVLGFALAGLAVHLPRGGEAPLRQLAVALFVLGIPLFDTALVWVSRRAARRPFLQGGRDHTTHRLMALGLSERRTVLAVYGVAAALGGIGVAVARGDLGTAVITAIVGGITLVLLGVFLGDVTVYKTPEGRAALTRSRNPALLYGVELAVDMAIVSAAWLGAYAIRFGGVALPEGGPALPFYLQKSALPALPFVIAFKVSALLVFNLYRGFWRTIHLKDVSAIAKAISLASVLAVVAATVLDRFENYSRAVFAIDWLLCFVGVLASRSALRVLRDTLARLVGRKQRAVLLGPDALRPLLEASLAGDAARYELAGVVAAGEPEAVLSEAQRLEAEVILLGEPLEEDDPQIAALLGAGLLVRRLSVVLE